MSVSGPGCVKTCTSRECPELFSLFSSFDGGCQSGSFVIQGNRDKLSTRKFDVGVFTQPGSKAALTASKPGFRFAPISGHPPTNSAGPFRATTGLMHRSSWRRYSITSSARASNDCGIVISSALAVFKLMTSSNLVGACTGRSLGLSPFKIRSTYSAARR